MTETIDRESGATPRDFRGRLAGTSIDPNTLLSADYFNLFNEVIMLLSIFPELAEDLETWRFKTYEEHFNESGLPFAPLAVAAFREVPPTVRIEFDDTVDIMRARVEDARRSLRAQLEAGMADQAAADAAQLASELQQLVESGGLIVNGRQRSMNQAAIDDLF